ncbi:hypothetical protein IRT45_34910 [Nocardia sp. BSTN01]|uniref:hypothetical protein n=1 Tax=Nocardia sp. BSTN01 TaxID=2783665 RepID=UPI00188E698A|nr:hypothetical protein [Nocardia sp. BSTN01]MBF5002311.1 hypothetical protein [Nocardia sp. BSTN01]
MTPSVGRIVHFQHPDVGVCPALITAVTDEGDVYLTVCPPGHPPAPLNDAHNEPIAVPFAETATDRHWSWPPLVES